MKYSLERSEAVLALSVLILILTFILIAKTNAYKAASFVQKIEAVQKEIAVTIEGAVKKPGLYQIKEGMTVQQALRKAAPLPAANLKTLPLQKIIDEPMTLKVEELQEIEVRVKGAVQEPVTLRLAPGSRISDLKSKVLFTPETEKKFFRRRKLLKDGEEIEVPKKTVEQNTVN